MVICIQPGLQILSAESGEKRDLLGGITLVQGRVPNQFAIAFFVTPGWLLAKLG